MTSAPYELTHKSNGCIILICALSNTQILVTSKHSLGSSRKADETQAVEEEAVLSHAECGEIWLKKHLDAAGKTMESLAAALWSKNLTAVAEVSRY